MKGVKRLFVDEAQGLANPGLTLKIMYDEFQRGADFGYRIVQFRIENSLSDALTGRYLILELLPFSFGNIN